MNKETTVKTLGEQTESVSQSQIDHASEWIYNYIAENRERLENDGVPCIQIHEEYKKTTKWPIGRKAFAPMLHLVGLEKASKNRGFVYFLNNV